MKKGLSVLLIAAALFGFYGGAVSINDVLACKDYWEEEGKKSTADMNKLEDGLNQLKDNEEAYLDGLDQIEDGEEALAKGEADYEAGEKELAKGEADYAAAPGKLADAEKQIAEGEAKLADAKKKLASGKDQLDGLSKLIKGMNTIIKGYSNSWKPSYDKLADGRANLAKGIGGSVEALKTPAALLPESAQGAYIQALTAVAKDDGKQTAGAYKDFIKNTNTLQTSLETVSKTIADYDKKANDLLAALTAAKDSNIQFAGTVNAVASDMKKFSALIKVAKGDSAAAQFEAGVDQISGAYEEAVKTIASETEKNVKTTLASMTEAYLKSDKGQAAVKALMEKGLSQEDAVKKVQEAYVEEAKPQVVEKVQAEVTKQVTAAMQKNSTLTAGVKQLLGVVQELAKTLDTYNEQINGDSSPIKTQLLPGLKQFNSAATSSAIDKLAGAQDDIAGGISTIASAVLGNKTLRNGVKKAMGDDAIALLKAYKTSPNPLSTDISDFAKFEYQMDKTPGILAALTKARNILAKKRAEGLKTYNNGKKQYDAGAAKLAAGKKEYAQGLKDYKAAPAKLADGRRQLADGLQKLMDGRKELAEGKEKLAEYEDGEQQVRDGLATLMATEPDGGLESILDRRDGDADFDNGDEHLDLDEGLDAVDVGRGYQSDSGVLITKEIMARAIGSVAGLAAAVFAILAGLLSLLKKNKGAAVSALLSAAAAGFGLAYGISGGREFSEIAGSTTGNTGWIAFGVVAGIAVIHAIVHFTAKKEA